MNTIKWPVVFVAMLLAFAFVTFPVFFIDKHKVILSPVFKVFVLHLQEGDVIHLPERRFKYVAIKLPEKYMCEVFGGDTIEIKGFRFNEVVFQVKEQGVKTDIWTCKKDDIVALDNFEFSQIYFSRWAEMYERMYRRYDEEQYKKILEK